MEWFRWYGGTFGDPKLQWVARKSGHIVAAVLAVWVAVLERAHKHEQRGCCDGLDFESMDVVLGLNDGACLTIYQAMILKGMVKDGNTVVSWDKRQPKREDEGAAERQKAKRDKDKLISKIAELENQLNGIMSQPITDVTQCHATSQQVTLEEIRLEEKRETLKPQQQQQACEQLKTVVEEHLVDLVRLFPEIDLPVAVEKLLHHFRDSPPLLDPWMTALKWFQREFKPLARASPVGQKLKSVSREDQTRDILAANAAACRDFCQEVSVHAG